MRADGEVETLSDGGLVLGMFENVVYDGGRVEMRPGDTLVVYSDGVTETWDPDGEEFGEEGLVPFVVRSRALGRRGAPERHPARDRGLRGRRPGHRRPHDRGAQA